MRNIGIIIIGALLISIMLLSGQLFSQSLPKNANAFKLEMSVYGQYNIYGSAIRQLNEGEDIISSSFASGWEFGFGLGKQIGSNSILSIGVSHSNIHTVISYNSEYKKRVVDYFEALNGTTLEMSWYTKYAAFSYTKVDINYTYQFYNKKNTNYAYLGTGIAILHYRDYSNTETSSFLNNDTTYSYSVFLVSRAYTNSKYENGRYNKYRSIDFGINFFGGYHFKLFRGNYLSIGLSYVIQPRYTHVVYYETTTINPFESYGKIIQPMNYLGLKLSYIYQFN